MVGNAREAPLLPQSPSPEILLGPQSSAELIFHHGQDPAFAD